MLIAEMEAHHTELLAFENQIAAMESRMDFPAVFQVCEESFSHVAPAISFRKRRSLVPEVPTLQAFEVVWTYAPPLFEHSTLISTLDFVRSTRLLAKHANGYVESAESALSREATARRLWNFVEQRPGSSEATAVLELGVSSSAVTSILDVWNRLGVITKDHKNGADGLILATRLDEEIAGVCCRCEARVRTRKINLLQPRTCPKCGEKDYFYISTITN
jgi:hypothetical protein